MKKSLIEIYALAVCFITVACFVVTFGLALWDVVEFTVPEFTINQSQYERHQSDDEYSEYISRRSQYKGENAEPIPSGEELTKAREKSYAFIIASERRTALQDFFQKLIIILVDTIAFFIHWRIAGKARRENN